MQKCNRCGSDYSGHSMGGPGICPACDCGYSVERAREMNRPSWPTSENRFDDRDARIAALESSLAERERECERLKTLASDEANDTDELRDAIDEFLPNYVLDDGTDEPANHVETVEYAGDEIKRLTRRAESAESALAAANMELEGSRAREAAENLARHRVQEDLAAARGENEHDRSRVAEAVAAIGEVLRGYGWLCESRGSYAYDDEGFQQEFGAVHTKLVAALEPLRRIAADWSNCPETQLEIVEARKKNVELRQERDAARKDLAAAREENEHWIEVGREIEKCDPMYSDDRIVLWSSSMAGLRGILEANRTMRSELASLRARDEGRVERARRCMQHIIDVGIRRGELFAFAPEDARAVLAAADGEPRGEEP